MERFAAVFRSLGFIFSGRGGKALLILGLGACIYQLWAKWRTRRLISTRFQGKVVLITGASSGLGEGSYLMYKTKGYMQE
jgi:hypothetical protein